ncbi:deazaflavin-dependent oxidoreductase (nitroreductase family) [Allocatelliglobosispora scoriae]|uniref:Deazaflavin-dependent oxidoreductase (Nitroreductase family) n=1 Tax=Allocatelliglobosispora scoriae TaxID=643052 RepID=A0A841C3G7_9ACTN|nr:nitroreductase family deazaflavin-dependent oxidoreductase [Allocatelliglobosispora scoriae]MBB5874456.1 deazaflavin-dependent oxidoreductase (nitroreductase family) [Allocatelliglobosispora scoriae]
MAHDANAWNRRIIEEFRANEGRVGGPFEGAPMMLMHHIGVKSGTERVSPLVYFPQEDGRMVVIASDGGAPANPGWYYNLKANPKVTVEVGTETFSAVAEEIAGEAREALWPALVAERPGFGEYQAKVTRTIPVFALTRQD